jgi:hypothetical protein
MHTFFPLCLSIGKLICCYTRISYLRLAKGLHCFLQSNIPAVQRMKWYRCRVLNHTFPYRSILSLRNLTQYFTLLPRYLESWRLFDGTWKVHRTPTLEKNEIKTNQSKSFSYKALELRNVLDSRKKMLPAFVHRKYTILPENGLEFKGLLVQCCCKRMD